MHPGRTRRPTVPLRSPWRPPDPDQHKLHRAGPRGARALWARTHRSQTSPARPHGPGAPPRRRPGVKDNHLLSTPAAPRARRFRRTWNHDASRTTCIRHSGRKRSRRRQRPAPLARREVANMAGHHAAGRPPGPSLDHATSDSHALVAKAHGRDDRRPRGPALEGLLHVQQHRGRAPPADVLDGRQRHAPPGVVLSAHAPHGMLRHAHAPARPTDGQPRTAGSESRQVPSAEEGVLVRGAQATSPLDDADQGVHRTRAPAEVDPLHLATGGGAPARAPQGPGALAPCGVGLERPRARRWPARCPHSR